MQSDQYEVGRECVSSEVSGQDRNNYDVHKSAPVQDMLRAMLGPCGDENGDAYDKLAQKMQQLYDIDCRKPKMIEMWTLKENGSGSTLPCNLYIFMNFSMLINVRSCESS